MSRSRKKTRRFLKRVAERKHLDYTQAIESFYGKKPSMIGKKLFIELTPDSPAGRIV